MASPGNGWSRKRRGRDGRARSAYRGRPAMLLDSILNVSIGEVPVL